MSRTTESLSPAPAASPWPGLAAYSEAERGCFFGRDTEVREIAESVRTHRITVLHGPAGSGKSSLLAAGLAPSVRESGCPVHLLRLDSTPAAPAAEVQFRAALAVLCASEALPYQTWLDRWGALSLAAIMDDPAMLPADWGNVPRCLLLDQFEEVFPFGRAGARKLELPALFTALADITAQPPLPGKPHRRRHCGPGSAVVHVLVSLRSDFLPRLEPWLRQVPALEHRILLAPLDGLRAAEVLLGPRGEDGTPLVDLGAARRIVQLAAGRDDSTPLDEIRVVPPFLSLLCRQLSQAAPDGRIREEAVRTGTTAILHRFYEDSLAAHPPAVRQYIEDHLVSAAGRRESVPRAAMEAALAESDIPDAADVTDDLLARRLLTARTSGSAVHVELAHDQLADVVQPGHLALLEVEERRETEVRTVLLRRDRRAQWSRYLRNIRRTALAGIAFVALSAGWLTLRHQKDMAEGKAREAASALRLQEARVKWEAFGLQKRAVFFATTGEPCRALAALAEALSKDPGIPADEVLRIVFPKYPLRLPFRALLGADPQFEDRVVAISSDGSLAYLQLDRRMTLFELGTGKVRWQASEDIPAYSVFSPDGKFLAGISDGKVGAWLAASGQKVWQHGEAITTSQRHSEYQELLEPGPDPEEITLWPKYDRGEVIRIADGHLLRVIPGRTSRDGEDRKAKARSPDGTKTAMLVKGEGIRIWDGVTLYELSRLKGSAEESPVMFSENGTQLWSRGSFVGNSWWCGWDTFSGKRRHLIPGGRALFSRDGSTVAVESGRLMLFYRVSDRSLDWLSVINEIGAAIRFWKRLFCSRPEISPPAAMGELPGWFPTFLRALVGSRLDSEEHSQPLGDQELLDALTVLLRAAQQDQSEAGHLLRRAIGTD